MAKSKKEKRQKFIRKILKDNKVSKKEVQKAAKKGIKLDRITKAARKSTQPGNVFSRPQSSSSPADTYKSGGGQPSQAKATTPAAPVIRPGAQTLIDRDTAARAAAAVQIAGINNTTPGPSTPGDTAGAGTGATDPVVNPLQGDLDAALGRIGDLEGQLSKMPDFESIFAQQAERDAAQRRADMEAMKQQQSLYMEELAARQAEQERQRLLTSQTQQTNMARSGLTPDFRIGGRRTDLLGTGGFKRRRKIRPATIAQGILPAVAATANATGNLLNV